MKLRYLIDENLSPRIVATIRRYYPNMDVLRVGDAGAPALGILDPDLLHWLETHQHTLVTDNRKSIPGHLTDHLAIAGHHWGIFMIRKDVPLKSLADALYVYWNVTEAEQWIDLVEWLAV